LHFLGHEYFHHYNVKRIRPIELGPFDYENGSRSRQVWISEGINVYYEYLVVKRAGITRLEETLGSLTENIRAYEYGSGHRFQSLVGASLDTWAEGANNQNVSGTMQGDDVVNKTISYYDKGPIIGLMLDFAIRHHSGNKKSLDDVMRFLYQEYYKKRHRGFTEPEFQKACETAAGTSLAELFLYVSTVKDPDYRKYFNYGGLDIDTVSREVPGLSMGLNLRNSRGDTLRIISADLGSPASAAGLHGGMALLEVNGVKATTESLKAATADKRPGDPVEVTVLGEDGKKTVTVKPVKASRPSYDITVLPNPDALQKEILESWGRVTVN
jgi:predicted metalloprotease with PDZ domain